MISGLRLRLSLPVRSWGGAEARPAPVQPRPAATDDSRDRGQGGTAAALRAGRAEVSRAGSQVTGSVQVVVVVVVPSGGGCPSGVA